MVCPRLLVLTLAFAVMYVNAMDDVPESNGYFSGKFKLMNNGKLCEDPWTTINTEEECIAAAKFLDLEYRNSWVGPGDFQYCVLANDGGGYVYFNKRPNVGDVAVNKQYTGVCKDRKQQQQQQLQQVQHPQQTQLKLARKFKLMDNGNLCKDPWIPINTEEECIAAAKFLDLEYSKSWVGPGDFPDCLLANDGRRYVYFNRSPKASEVAVNKQYAGICQDQKPQQQRQPQQRQQQHQQQLQRMQQTQQLQGRHMKGELTPCTDEGTIRDKSCVCDQDVCTIGFRCVQLSYCHKDCVQNVTISGSFCFCGQKNTVCQLRFVCVGHECIKVCEGVGYIQSDIPFCWCKNKKCFSGSRCLEGSCHADCKPEKYILNGPCNCNLTLCEDGKMCVADECLSACQILPNPINNYEPVYPKDTNTPCECGAKFCNVPNKCIAGICLNECEGQGPIERQACLCNGEYCHLGSRCILGICGQICVNKYYVSGPCYCGEVPCGIGNMCIDRICRSAMVRYLQWKCSEATTGGISPFPIPDTMTLAECILLCLQNTDCTAINMSTDGDVEDRSCYLYSDKFDINNCFFDNNMNTYVREAVWTEYNETKCNSKNSGIKPFPLKQRLNLYQCKMECLKDLSCIAINRKDRPNARMMKCYKFHHKFELSLCNSNSPLYKLYKREPGWFKAPSVECRTDKAVLSYPRNSYISLKACKKECILRDECRAFTRSDEKKAKKCYLFNNDFKVLDQCIEYHGHSLYIKETVTTILSTAKTHDPSGDWISGPGGRRKRDIKDWWKNVSNAVSATSYIYNPIRSNISAVPPVKGWKYANNKWYNDSTLKGIRIAGKNDRRSRESKKIN